MKIRSVCLALGLSAGSVDATALLNPPYDNSAAVMAASCLGCHSANSKLPTLTLQSQEDLFDTLMAFRSGERHSTVMKRITLGYTQKELGKISSYFASYTSESGVD